MSYYFEKLTGEYAGWQAANKLQLGAAEDHLKDPNLTPDLPRAHPRATPMALPVRMALATHRSPPGMKLPL